jgi:cytidine deaminase
MTLIDHPAAPLDDEALIALALEVRVRAHAPYSRFQVGAVLRTPDGRVYTGVNVENASYPVGCCAERTALGTAVTAGDTRFDTVVVATSAPVPVMPCGMCAQALHEFAPDARVIAVTADGRRREARVSEILPFAYAGEGLERS